MKFSLDEQQFPPFEGFSKEGMRFFTELKKHNTREWFAENKDRFEEQVKFPMQCLIHSLQPLLKTIAPSLDVHPKRSIFRIYRDTRFSKDKTPYKTHIAAHFVPRGDAKGFLGSGLYMHIEPGEIFLGGGIYMPDAPQLKKIRQAIATRQKEFLSIINAAAFKKTFGALEGDRLQRVPKGYSPDHPMAEWLKYKQFFVGVELKEKECYSRQFPKTVVSVYQKVMPLVNFLNDALS